MKPTKSELTELLALEERGSIDAKKTLKKLYPKPSDIRHLHDDLFGTAELFFAKLDYLLVKGKLYDYIKVESAHVWLDMTEMEEVFNEEFGHNLGSYDKKDIMRHPRFSTSNTTAVGPNGMSKRIWIFLRYSPKISLFSHQKLFMPPDKAEETQAQLKAKAKKIQLVLEKREKLFSSRLKSLLLSGELTNHNLKTAPTAAVNMKEVKEKFWHFWVTRISNKHLKQIGAYRSCIKSDHSMRSKVTGDSIKVWIFINPICDQVEEERQASSTTDLFFKELDHLIAAKKVTNHNIHGDGKLKVEMPEIKQQLEATFDHHLSLPEIRLIRLHPRCEAYNVSVRSRERGPLKMWVFLP